MFLNAMAAKRGISETLSPREIVIRQIVEWKKLCTGEFAEYVEAHYNADMSNTPKSCTYTTISLGINGNIQRTKKVFDSTTGTVKKPRNVITFLMPDCIVHLVNQ